MEMPIGSIIIWAGDSAQVPSNWRICNGTSLKKTDYAELYSILGENWIKDEGFHTDFFRIPDLRGVFLRGVNDERNDVFKDPDADNRIRLKSGTTIASDAPGSFQRSEIQHHKHAAPLVIGGGSSGPRLAISIDAQPGEGHSYQGVQSTEETGGSETRPVNAYVHYIIKVKP